MGLESLIASMAMGKVDTSNTSCNRVEVSLPPAPVLDCTPDTSETCECINTQHISSDPTSQEQAQLARLVELVWRKEGWHEEDIAKAVINALANYHDALICFTELAKIKGISPETGISSTNY